jgi:OOP family OmpA-OmpF porin
VKDLVATIKRENVELKQIQVIGHTDAIGSDRSNYALGLKRAQTVPCWLKTAFRHV